jgi:hypothetical protein
MERRRRDLSRPTVVVAVGLVAVVGLLAWLLPGIDREGPADVGPTPIANPDRTMQLESDGLTIDLVDTSGSTAAPWPAPDAAEPPLEFSMTAQGVTVPQQSSGSGGQWLLIQDPGDPGGTSSLANVHREVGGALTDLQFRVWSGKTEFVWTSDVERTWTVAWDGQPPLPLAETSFTHDERAETTRTYEFEGLLADDDAPEGTPVSVTFGRGIPGTAELSIPESGGEPARAAPVIGSHAAFVEWNSFIEDPMVEVPTECTNAWDPGTFVGDDRGFASGAAQEAFTATGEPRSRISTRVGAAFSPLDPGLNARVFDDWIYRGVGVTEEYSQNGILLRSAWAGRSGLELLSSSSSVSLANRSVRTGESDPLCKILFWDAPNIDVDYDVIFRSTGGLSVAAIFDIVPSHEVLWEITQNPDGTGARSSGCIYRRHQSWFYLLPLPDPFKKQINYYFADEATLPTECPIDNADEDD